MAVRIVCYGDSRVAGVGNRQDYPVVPGPLSTYGSVYTTDAGLSVQVTPQAGKPGSGFAMTVKRNPRTGKISAGILSRGAGYIDGGMPTLQILGSPTGLTPPDLTFSPSPAGGYIVGVENYLRAQGLAGCTVINFGEPGSRISGSNLEQSDGIAVEASAGDPAQSLIVISIGVNDELQGFTAQQYHDGLLAAVQYWVTDGYPVMINYPFGVQASSSNAAAHNAAIQAFPAQIDSIIATNPTRIFKGIDEYALIGTAPTYFFDEIHQSAAGDAVLAPAIGARVLQVLTTLGLAPSVGNLPPLDPAAFTAMITTLLATVNAHTDARGRLVLRQSQRDIIQREMLRLSQSSLRLDPNDPETLAALLILSKVNAAELTRFVTGQ